jgi:hypothetical protein
MTPGKAATGKPASTNTTMCRLIGAFKSVN